MIEFKKSMKKENSQKTISSIFLVISLILFLSIGFWLGALYTKNNQTLQVNAVTFNSPVNASMTIKHIFMNSQGVYCADKSEKLTQESLYAENLFIAKSLSTSDALVDLTLSFRFYGTTLINYNNSSGNINFTDKNGETGVLISYENNIKDTENNFTTFIFKANAIPKYSLLQLDKILSNFSTSDTKDVIRVLEIEAQVINSGIAVNDATDLNSDTANSYYTYAVNTQKA